MDWFAGNWYNLLAWAAEFFVVLFCMYGVFGERLKLRSAIVVMTGVDVLVFSLIKEQVLPEVFTICLYGMTFFYAWKVFRRKLLETIGRYMMGIIIVGAVQIVVSYLSLSIIAVWGEGGISRVIMNLICLLISILFYWITRKREILKLVFQGKEIVATVLICGVLLLFLLLDYRLRGGIDHLYYPILVGVLLALYFYWFREQKTRFQLEKKEMEQKIQEVYRQSYEELLFEIRRRQHDYKNQLGAICSMHYTATDFDELVKRQKEYIAVLMEESRYDSILTRCNHPTLAGYLYNKCVSYEKEEIVVEHDIRIDQAICCLPLHEMIEMLGIFLENAKECSESQRDKERKIRLQMEETEHGVTIEVSNPSRYLTGQEIERIFEQGYSTKGSFRGIGLFRVKQLAEKSKSDLIVENRMISEENWISFQVNIPK